MVRAFGPKELVKHPKNPCFGCGPAHPKGLGLSFLKDGERVIGSLEVTMDLQGFPDRLHSGMLYAALIDAAKWTVIGLRNRMGVPIRTSALSTRRWGLVGERLTLVGRITRSSLRTVTVKCEAGDQNRALVASLERDFEILPRQQFMVRLGYDKLPESLDELVPP